MCTEECGQLSPPDEQELIGAFRAAARDAFGLLGPEYGLQPSEVVAYSVDGDARRPVAPADAKYPFLVVIEYTGTARPVRLSYGGRSYDLDLEIGANGSGFHPIASWLDALGVEPERDDDSGVATPAAISLHSRRLAGAMGEHFWAINNAGREVVERLPLLGAKTAPRLNRTRDRAHSAFAAGDYAGYIELLAPFEAALTVTERRKLDFARART